MRRPLFATVYLYRRQFTCSHSYLNTFLRQKKHRSIKKRRKKHPWRRNTPGVANVPVAADDEDNGSICLQCITGLAECKFS